MITRDIFLSLSVSLSTRSLIKIVITLVFWGKGKWIITFFLDNAPKLFFFFPPKLFYITAELSTDNSSFLCRRPD